MEVKKSPAKRGRKPKVPKQIPPPFSPPPAEPIVPEVKKADKVEDDAIDDDQESNETLPRTTRRSQAKSPKKSEESSLPSEIQTVNVNDGKSQAKASLAIKEPQVKLKPVEISLTAVPIPKDLQLTIGASKSSKVEKELKETAVTDNEIKPKRGRKATVASSSPPRITTEAPTTVSEKSIDKLAKKLRDKLPEKSEDKEKIVKAEEVTTKVVKKKAEPPISPEKGQSSVTEKNIPPVKNEKAEKQVEQKPEKIESEDEEEEDHVKALFQEHGGRFGRTGLKVSQILDDVEALLQYQEQQRRLRNHTLMDSPEATKIMKKYKRKKAKKFSILSKHEGKLVLSRVYDKPVHTIQRSADFQFKFKLVRNSVNIVENHLETDKVKLEHDKDEDTEKSEIIKQPTKKRGRPPKKAILEDLQAGLAPSITNETTSSPPTKRRLIEPEEVPNESPTKDIVAPVESTEDKPQRRGRGRPPKKAIIAEIEAELAAAEKAKENVMNENRQVVDETEGEDKPIKKRGRVKKDEVTDEAGEKFDEEETAEPPVKKRALRERKPMSLAETADDDFDILANLDMDEKLPKKSENDSSASLAANKPNPVKSPPVSSQAKDNDRYVVQHVDQNPLKIKLKTGFQELPSNEPAAPLKIKFSLKGGSGAGDLDESSPLVKKVKKHKKKKEKVMDEQQVKDKIILRIKSPSNRSDNEPGNNGYLGWNNDKYNDNNKGYTNATTTNAAARMANTMMNSESNQVNNATVSGDQVTFSPESSPEHQGNTTATTASFIMDSSLGLGEGQFKDLMKAIDSDDENTKPAKVTTATPWMTDKASTSQLDGNVELSSDNEDEFESSEKEIKVVIVKYHQPVQQIYDLNRDDNDEENPQNDGYDDKIDQLDGENDLILDDIEASTSGNGSGNGSTTAGSSTLYILKSQDAKVYQCAQCPEVFPGQKALLTHQSLVHHDSLTIYPCQQCSIGFRDANSLEIHMRNEHGKQQIVTIIQADLHTRDTGSTASGSSSCSSSTTSSHPSSSSSGYLSAGSSSANSSTHHSDLLGTSSSSSSSHPLLMKQDPVLMFNSDEEQDLMLDESLNLFETSSLIDSGDSAIHLSLDDLANFATQPMVTTDGSHTSFDTSIETSSFLSGTDALDIINDAANSAPMGSACLDQRTTSMTGSRTPSISDDGEFPCTQCEKRFGNRRNLLSHMRRHTGDFKLFCDHCSKGFFTQSKLESHKRKHTGNNNSFVKKKKNPIFQNNFRFR